MDAERWRTVREIFEGALERAPSAIEAFLAEACAGDPECAAQVRRLLVADSASPAWLEPAAGLLRPLEPAPVPLESGRHVGSFRLLRVVGEGGMGTVYEAEQASPRRRVALKVLRLGSGSPASVRRFRYEAEILARLQHPGIAQVFEAGVDGAAGGIEVPFIAMEFVSGARDLLSFARERALDLRGRLALFLQLCDAVQHGHEKGIIHRDLKPSNVLVDEQGRIKVIDFGVARATDADLSRITLATETGRLFGTLQYMSPEQLGPDPRAADTRSDVYALGVIFYELLCGALPHELGSLSLTEAARRVREVPIRRPSSVSPGLDRELEWIATKALAATPGDRYGTVPELAADLRRHLAHEPVLAGPPSAGYRLAKFARRHWKGVAMASALAVLGAAGLLGTSLGWREAVRQEWTAREEARRAGAIREVLHSLLIVASPNAKGVEVGLLEALDTIMEDVVPYLAADPDLQVATLTDIGGLFREIGQRERAIRLLDRAVAIAERELGPSSLDLAAALLFQGLALQSLGRFDEAFACHRRAAEICERAGATEQALAARTNMALALGAQGMWAECTRALEELHARYVDDHGSESLQAIDALAKVADAYRLEGRFDEAVRAFDRVLALRRRTTGSKRLQLFADEHNLAAALTSLGRFEEAYEHESIALAGWLELLGPTGTWTLTALNNAAGQALASGEPAAAERHARSQLEFLPAGADLERRQVEIAMVLGASLVAQGRCLEGEEILRGSNARAEGSGLVLSPSRSILGQGALGRALWARGEIEQGTAQMRAARAAAAEELDPLHWVARALQLLCGEALAARGPDAAEVVRTRSGE